MNRIVLKFDLVFTINNSTCFWHKTFVLVLSLETAFQKSFALKWPKKLNVLQRKTLNEINVQT